MFKNLRAWFLGATAAVVGFVGGIQWDEIKSKLEETGVKSHCEGRVTADTCSIDQKCSWDWDAKVCKEK